MADLFVNTSPMSPAAAICLRCEKNREPDIEHICDDLIEDETYNPLRMEIDIDNINKYLIECRQLVAVFEGIVPFLGNDKTLLIINDFQQRIQECQKKLLKLFALHAPYRLNKWEAVVTQLEHACKALEKRIVGF